MNTKENMKNKRNISGEHFEEIQEQLKNMIVPVRT